MIAITNKSQPQGLLSLPSAGVGSPGDLAVPCPCPPQEPASVLACSRLCRGGLRGKKGLRQEAATRQTELFPRGQLAQCALWRPHSLHRSL